MTSTELVDSSRCSTRATRSTRTRPASTKNATPTPFGIVYPPATRPARATSTTCSSSACSAAAAASGRRGRASCRRPASATRRRAPRRSSTGPAAGVRARRVEVALEVEALEPEPGACALRSRTRPPVAGGLTRAEALRALADLDARRAAHARRALPSRRSKRRLRQRQHLAGAGRARRRRRARRRDLPARPPAARAGEPRQPLRRHRDRGGAAAARACALGRRARGDRGGRPGGARDGRARAGVDARGHHAPARADAAGEPSRGSAPAREEPAPRAGVVDGRTFRPGDQLVLRLAGRSDPYDRMLDGRTATLERIYIDYDDSVHLAVTVDSDPMQEVMRETGRFLFFFPDEVEVRRARR